MELGSLNFYIEWSYLKIRKTHFGEKCLLHYTTDMWGVSITVASVTLIMHVSPVFYYYHNSPMYLISCEKVGRKYYFCYPPPFQIGQTKAQRG